MSEQLSIARKLKARLAANDEENADRLADAMIAAAIDKNTTAIKMVVELVEPPRQEEAPQRRLTDEEIVELFDRLAERAAAFRDQPAPRA